MSFRLSAVYHGRQGLCPIFIPFSFVPPSRRSKRSSGRRRRESVHLSAREDRRFLHANSARSWCSEMKENYTAAAVRSWKAWTV